MNHIGVSFTVVTLIVEFYCCRNSLIFGAISLETYLLAQLLVFQPQPCKRIPSGSFVVLVLSKDGVFVGLLCKQGLLLIREIPNWLSESLNCYLLGIIGKCDVNFSVSVLLNLW